MNISLPFARPWMALGLIGWLLFACQSGTTNTQAEATDAVPVMTVSQQEDPRAFDRYWYQGKAELTSYDLEQARYGEVHQGEAVLIFVTEDFSAKRLVKLNDPQAAGNDLVKILKLNFTKKFNTGLYPYSMMSSVFTPVDLQKYPASLKTTMSSQEWCGHTFTQLNLRGREYEVSGYSYFEEEGEEVFQLNKAWLEDELWTRIRISPDLLPTGTFDMIPGSFFTRLRHVPLRVESATATLKSSEDDPAVREYHLRFDAHNRSLKIQFQRDFPYEILGWEETYLSGFGPGAKLLTTRATRNQSIFTDYWTHHNVADSVWREKLGLK